MLELQLRKSLRETKSPKVSLPPDPKTKSTGGSWWWPFGGDDVNEDDEEEEFFDAETDVDLGVVTYQKEASTYCKSVAHVLV